VKVLQHCRQAADMISIRMGQDDGIERSNTSRQQGRDDDSLPDIERWREGASTVDQDPLTRRQLQQDGITAAHIECGEPQYGR
jgi:hypothetical protein